MLKGALAEKRSEHKYALVSSRLVHPGLIFASPTHLVKCPYKFMTWEFFKNDIGAYLMPNSA